MNTTGYQIEDVPVTHQTHEPLVPETCLNMTDTRQYIDSHEKPGTSLRIVKTNLVINGKNL